MTRGDYRLACRSCRYIRPWPEKEAMLRDVYGPVRCDAYFCVHPDRIHPQRVDRDDSPCNGSSTRGASSCPMKLREMGVSQ